MSAPPVQPLSIAVALGSPFLLLIERLARGRGFAEGLWVPALGGFLVSVALRSRVRRSPSTSPDRRALRLAATLPTLALWAWFYAVDLLHARFAWTLLLVPALAGIGGLLGGARGLLLGAALGFTTIWAQMFPRADNGCTGVSGAYGDVLWLHPVLCLWPAPWVLGPPRRPPAALTPRAPPAALTPP